jgi:hypothetical protein
LQALDGLLPVIERRRGGEPGIRSVQFLEGRNLWRAGEKGLWSWPLLAAALSRSHSPQGDAVLDGRTQDLVGLGLVPKLAHNPRGWLLEHRDGLRTAILILDGVVADFNFAVRAQHGDIVSAPLFRAPPPAEHHFSRLAAVMEDFFRGSEPPWPVERSLLVSGLLGRSANLQPFRPARKRWTWVPASWGPSTARPPGSGILPARSGPVGCRRSRARPEASRDRSRRHSPALENRVRGLKPAGIPAIGQRRGPLRIIRVIHFEATSSRPGSPNTSSA